jgi:hypothetical protein
MSGETGNETCSLSLMSMSGLVLRLTNKKIPKGILCISRFEEAAINADFDFRRYVICLGLAECPSLRLDD